MADKTTPAGTVPKGKKPSKESLKAHREFVDKKITELGGTPARAKKKKK
jgi:hypothetical protein